MYKQSFILDTDSLIKLTKSGMINVVCKHFNCMITEEVYEEAVTKGKEGLHRDAFEIEKIIKNRSLRRRKTEEKTIKRDNLGKGEKSTFVLSQKSRNSVIVSDDNTFINFLREEKSEFIIPADFITLLKKLNKIKSKEALTYINNMEPYIKPKVYLKIKNKIGGLK